MFTRFREFPDPRIELVGIDQPLALHPARGQRVVGMSQESSQRALTQISMFSRE
jgi:hypothetical protein